METNTKQADAKEDGIYQTQYTLSLDKEYGRPTAVLPYQIWQNKDWRDVLEILDEKSVQSNHYVAITASALDYIRKSRSGSVVLKTGTLEEMVSVQILNKEQLGNSTVYAIDTSVANYKKCMSRRGSSGLTFI